MGDPNRQNQLPYFEVQGALDRSLRYHQSSLEAARRAWTLEYVV
jgi:hypothetical protein